MAFGFSNLTGRRLRLISFVALLPIEFLIEDRPGESDGRVAGDREGVGLPKYYENSPTSSIVESVDSSLSLTPALGY